VLKPENERSINPPCPECGSETVRKLSAPNIKFNGSGFPSNDSKTLLFKDSIK
jgi:predicted nucleic acid-binding Zn ribbon protein